MVEIDRPQTEIEKNLKAGGFKDLRTWKKTDPKQNALAEISRVEYEYAHKKKIPYCTVCAIRAVDKSIQDLKDKILAAKREGKSYFEMGEAKNKTICQSLGIDLTKFAGEDLFVKTDDSEVQETQNVNNIRTRVKTGIWKNYVCKSCGSNLSMEIRNDQIPLNDGPKGEGTTDGLQKIK